MLKTPHTFSEPLERRKPSFYTFDRRKNIPAAEAALKEKKKKAVEDISCRIVEAITTTK